MREAHQEVAKVVNAVPRYFRLFRDAATSKQNLQAATHWVWLWLPEATDSGAEFSKSAVHSILTAMRTGEFFKTFPVNPEPRRA